MLMNTGERAVPSKHGLLTTVAFQLGPQARCQFALEGSVAAAGATLTWLKDKLGLVDSPAQVDKLAESVRTRACMRMRIWGGVVCSYS